MSGSDDEFCGFWLWQWQWILVVAVDCGCSCDGELSWLVVLGCCFVFCIFFLRYVMVATVVVVSDGGGRYSWLL